MCLQHLIFLKFVFTTCILQHSYCCGFLTCLSIFPPCLGLKWAWYVTERHLQSAVPLAAKSFDFGRTVWKHLCSHEFNHYQTSSKCWSGMDTYTWGCPEKSLLEWTTKASSLGGNTVTDVTEMIVY